MNESSSSLRAAPSVSHGDISSHQVDGHATLHVRKGNGSKLLRNTEPRAKRLAVRPVALEPTRVLQPPLDRDSTRVLAFPSGRAGVIFSKGPDGERPPQKHLGSISAAERMASEYKTAKVVLAFLGWIARGCR